MVVTTEGQPFEVVLCPDKYYDNKPFLMCLDLPKGSNFYGDSAYTNYEREEKLRKRGIRVIIDPKANYCRPLFFEDWLDFKYFRRTIEMTVSRIFAFLPKKIHAVTDSSFELKVIGFVTALAIILL